MQRRSLTRGEVENLVFENRYGVKQEDENKSRCIDGRYGKNKSLCPLAKPGADTGDLMVVFAANREYELGIEPKNVFKVVLKTVGGEKNFHFHTDESFKKGLLGCGHFKHAASKPKIYGLTKAEIEKMDQFLSKTRKEGGECTVLEGEHKERAVLIVKGEGWSVFPWLEIKKASRSYGDKIEVFVYQKSLDDKRRRRLAREAVPFVGLDMSFLDEEYLYEVLSQISDSHLLETLSRSARNLPTFEVIFDKKGDFEVEKI